MFDALIDNIVVLLTSLSVMFGSFLTYDLTLQKPTNDKPFSESSVENRENFDQKENNFNTATNTTPTGAIKVESQEVVSINNSPSVPPEVSEDKVPEDIWEGISTEEKQRLEELYTIYETPSLPVDDEVKKLLSSLKNSKHSNKRRPEPKDACENSKNNVSSTPTKSSSLPTAPGVFFDIDSYASQSERKDVSRFIEVHAYDSKGGHVGLTPTDQSSEYYPLALPEERSSIWWSDSFAYSLLLAINEFDDARLVMKSKDFNGLVLALRGGGNDCDITSVIEIPLSPYSVLTLPITTTADIGPISYDLDGDDIGDFEISLTYEMSGEQTNTLNKLFVRLYELSK